MNSYSKGRYNAEVKREVLVSGLANLIAGIDAIIVVGVKLATEVSEDPECPADHILQNQSAPETEGGILVAYFLPRVEQVARSGVVGSLLKTKCVAYSDTSVYLRDECPIMVAKTAEIHYIIDERVDTVELVRIEAMTRCLFGVAGATVAGKACPNAETGDRGKLVAECGGSLTSQKVGVLPIFAIGAVVLIERD